MKPITYKEMLLFFSEDNPEEIAEYMSANINLLISGKITIEQYADLYRFDREIENEID